MHVFLLLIRMKTAWSSLELNIINISIMVLISFNLPFVTIISWIVIQRIFRAHSFLPPFRSFHSTSSSVEQHERRKTDYTETHEFRIKFVGFSIDFLSIPSLRSPAGRFPSNGKKQFPLFSLHPSQKDTSP